MVLAYWLIGREIVQELQGGKARANYGERVVEDLSARLTERFGKGFSTRNVKLFKQFYLTWHKTSPIGHPLVAQSSVPEIGQPPVAQSRPLEKLQPPSLERPPAISPQLTWSHYIALMRVNELEARDFYEREAVAGGWDKRTLERQIHTQYYHRCRHSQQPGKLLADGRRLQKTQPDHGELLKNPYVLEFLGYPNFAELRESDVEQAIITHLQRFLLELGSGFAFVARQKHIRIEDEDRFIDLVFYHCRLKFYLLIDLKINKVTHEDVGQMDGYVRMYDGLFTAPDDNPTIGLILCTEKNETVARYSVLNDRKQIFASKYMLCLPTEEQLRQEIERERRMIENTLLPDE
jgi:predicted nuclease of restriction endonuclease-like (RecB) superfamily